MFGVLKGSTCAMQGHERQEWMGHICGVCLARVAAVWRAGGSRDKEQQVREEKEGREEREERPLQRKRRHNRGLIVPGFRYVHGFVVDRFACLRMTLLTISIGVPDLDA